MPKVPEQKRRQEIIDHLVGNCDCGDEAQFSEDDFEVLNKFSTDQLEKLFEDKGEAEKPKEPVANKEPKKKEEEATLADGPTSVFNEESLPESVREELAFARNMMQQQKDQLISKITENKDCLFSKEELGEKSVEDLTKIAALAANKAVEENDDDNNASPPPRPASRLGGHAKPVANSDEELDDLLDLPVMNFGSSNN